MSQKFSHAVSVRLGVLVLFATVCALRMEAATFTVTSGTDSGAGSLRQAIADANSGDRIEFAAALNGSVLTLTSGELCVLKGLTIAGPGPALLALNGNASSRIFHLFPSNGTATVTISGLTLTNGSALVGGAIFSDTAWDSPSLALSVSNCAVRANRATDAPTAYGGGGGILAARNTSLTMTDSEVGANHANANGGGVWCYSTSTFDRCAFVGNTTSNSGGGLLIRHEPVVTIRECTFSGNACYFYNWQNDYGGGALQTQEKGNVRIYNSTITGNTANKTCGGIQSRGTTSMYLYSTLVAGNSDTQGYPDVSGVFSGVTNCLIQVTNSVALPGANNIFGQAPQLEPLANNGGPTRTHALKRSSPAVDRGANPLGLTSDQRGAGFPRSRGLAVDIGAFELPPRKGTLMRVD